MQSIQLRAEDYAQSLQCTSLDWYVPNQYCTQSDVGPISNMTNETDVSLVDHKSNFIGKFDWGILGSNVYDHSELKVISNCCYPNGCYPNFCHTNCGNFTWIVMNLTYTLNYLNLPWFTRSYLNLPKFTSIYIN